MIKLAIIKKLDKGKYRLFSRKKDKSGKRRNLGTFTSLDAAKKHEREVEYFKHLDDANDGKSEDKDTKIVSKLSDIASYLEKAGFVDAADKVYCAMDAVDGSFDNDEDYVVDSIVANTPDVQNALPGSMDYMMTGGIQNGMLGTFNPGLPHMMASLANKLDKLGMYDEANELEYVLRVFAMTYQEALSILSLQQGASKEDINSAYKSKALQNHPDTGGDLNTMKQINVARDALLGSGSTGMSEIEDDPLGDPDFMKDWHAAAAARAEQEGRFEDERLKEMERNPSIDVWNSVINGLPEDEQKLLEELITSNREAFSDEMEIWGSVLYEIHNQIQDLMANLYYGKVSEDEFNDESKEELDKLFEYKNYAIGKAKTKKDINPGLYDGIAEDLKDWDKEHSINSDTAKQEIVVLTERCDGVSSLYWFPKMSQEELEKWWGLLETPMPFYVTPENLPGDVLHSSDTPYIGGMRIKNRGDNLGFWECNMCGSEDSFLSRPDGSIVPGGFEKKPGGRLAQLANRLDKLGMYDEANELDEILKELLSDEQNADESEMHEIIKDLEKGQKTKGKNKTKTKEKDKEGVGVMVDSNGHVPSSVSQTSGFSGLSDAYFFSSYTNLEPPYGG